MSNQTISEGGVTLRILETKKISRQMPIFYNPVMSFNRDVAVLLLKSIKKQDLRIADPLAATGIRGARFLIELPAKKVSSVDFNDSNPNFKKNISKLIKDNNLPKKNISIHNEDANLFLLNSKGFDYIDVDPFGSPNQYLDSAIKRLSRKGILAVTATDTSALAGSHELACRRKYWARPLHNDLMHEVGIRILARKVQLIASQFEKALTPIFSHSTEHYMRIYFDCKKGKKSVDSILRQHKFLLFCHSCLQRFVSEKNWGVCENCKKEMVFAGPLWSGQLWDANLVKKMCDFADNMVLKKFLEIVLVESKISVVGFYSLSRICKILKCVVPKKSEIVEKLKNAGFFASQTHFAGDGIRTNAPVKDLFGFLNN